MTGKSFVSSSRGDEAQMFVGQTTVADQSLRRSAATFLPSRRSARGKEKATLTRGCAQMDFGPRLSSRAFLSPVALFDVFLDLPPFVTVLLSLGRAVVRLAEWVVGIAYDFCDGFYGFAHSNGFLSSVGTSVGTKAGGMPSDGKEGTALTTTVISAMVCVMVSLRLHHRDESSRKVLTKFAPAVRKNAETG